MTSSSRPDLAFQLFLPVSLRQSACRSSEIRYDVGSFHWRNGLTVSFARRMTPTTYITRLRDDAHYSKQYVHFHFIAVLRPLARLSRFLSRKSSSLHLEAFATQWQRWLSPLDRPCAKFQLSWLILAFLFVLPCFASSQRRSLHGPRTSGPRRCCCCCCRCSSYTAGIRSRMLR